MGAQADPPSRGAAGADHPDPIAERVVLQFLTCAATDARATGLRPLTDYLRRFPGHDERLTAEYAALGEAPLAGAPTDGLRPAASATEKASSRSSSREEATLGPFRLIRALGRGGQGVVHLADDTRYGREVALKLLPGFLGDGVPARLRREVEALARLDHPGIGVVYEAGEVEGQAYVAMRYVPGRTLAEHIDELRRRDGTAAPTRTEVAERVALIEGVAHALHAAHEAGVLHRDVKPANVLVHEDSGEPVLVDFGLARADDSALPTLTRTGDLLGTTPYMAPERLHGEGARDRRQDVWSLGVVLYELLTGSRPFDGPTVEAVARRIEWEEPRDPRRLARHVPRDLAVVIATALSKDRARRYPTALALAQDLERVRAGRPVLARPVGPLGRTLRWARRNPAPAALLAVLVLGLTATVLVAVQLADLATSERGARRVSQALLAKSNHEQARLLALSDTHGRRWRILQLLTQAAAALREAGGQEGLDARTVGAGLIGTGDLDIKDLPTPTDLRSTATEALLLPDGRLERVVQSSTFGQGRFDATGEVIALSFVSADMQTFGVFTQSVRTGRERHRMPEAEIISAAYAIAVEAGGAHVLTPSRDLAHLSLWSAGDTTRVHQIDVPPEIRPTPRASTWHLELLPDGVHVAGVVGPGKIGGAGPSGLLIARRDQSGPVLVRTEETFADPWLAVSRDGRRVVAPAGLMHVRLVTLPDPAAPDAADESAFTELTLDAGLPVLTASFVEVDGEPWRLAVACRDMSRTSDVLVSLDLDADGAIARRRERDLGFHLPLYAPITPSRDGRTLFIADLARGLHAVDARTGQQRLHLADIHDRRITDIAVLGDGRVATHSDQETTRLWEMLADPGLAEPLGLPEGERVAEFPASSADGAVVAVHAVHTEGDLVTVLLRTRDGTTHTLRVPPSAPDLGDNASNPDDPGGTPRGPDVLATAEPRLVLSADGRRLARLADDTITVWDLATDAPFSPRTVGADDGSRFLSVALPPERPAVAVQADREGVARVVDLATGAARVVADLPRQAWLRLAPDGRRLLAVPAVGARPPAHLSTGTPSVHVLGGSTRSTDLSGLPEGAFRELRVSTFSPDGRWLAGHVFLPSDEPAAAIADNLLMVWNIGDGDLRLAIPREDELRDATPDISPDGRWLAFADDDGRVRLFDIGDGTEILSWRAHASHLTGVRFLRGGTALLTADRSGAALVWDLAELGRRLDAMGLGW